MNSTHSEEDPFEVVAELRVRLHRSGALSVAGPVGDKEWCLAALENAKDAIRNHRGPMLTTPGGIEVPSKDVEIPSFMAAKGTL